MKYILKFLLLIPLFVFYGCEHTNELARYSLTDKNYLFKHSTSSSLSSVCVDINSCYESSNPIVVILSGIGSAYSEGEIRERLENAVNADSLSIFLSDGVKEGLNTYYKINIVNSIEEDPQFIVESRLEKFRLHSDSYGIFASVTCKVMIIDRYSAKTVWENTESSSVPINDVIITYGPTPLIRTTTSVINAIRLMNMSDAEIKAAINNSVKEAGKKQSDQLREDIAVR